MATQGSWKITLATLLPLWLLSIAITAEGFPAPPITLEVAGVAFALAVAIGIALAWAKWWALDLALYSLFPVVFFFIFDGISTSYKTPFILMCALVLSIGMIAAQRSKSVDGRWRVWLAVNIVTWIFASHALQAYWDMTDTLIFGDCFPYTKGCSPLAGNQIAWWVLFFRP